MNVPIPEERDAPLRLPLTIPVASYLRDHRVEGRIILPAVEILQYMAASARSRLPDGSVFRMQSARFDRFLEIPEGARVVEACLEIEQRGDESLSLRLLTRGEVGGTGITRTRVHAAVDVVVAHEAGAPLLPLDVAAAVDGVCCAIHAEALYRDLVPFGQAYQNVTGCLFLAADGAAAEVRAPEEPASLFPLGSPFPFDAALHVACAWGQRFHHRTVFPVGFEERIIVRPTVPGETYRCRIIPFAETAETLRFHIWIHDRTGGLREKIAGVSMKDVSGGRAHIPGWIRSDGSMPLGAMGEHCRAFSVIDRRTIAPFAEGVLGVAERARWDRMGTKRRGDFLAARLALKQLFRKLARGDLVTPAAAIRTVMEDGIHPCCGEPPNRERIFCSVSHCPGFAIAVADNEEIGVDVEKVSGRARRVRRLFMGAKELALTETSPLGDLHASLRIWSIKEGVAKIMDWPLVEAWRRVTVENAGWTESQLMVEGRRFAAFHDRVADYLFTVVKKGGH